MTILHIIAFITGGTLGFILSSLFLFGTVIDLESYIVALQKEIKELKR